MNSPKSRRRSPRQSFAKLLLCPTLLLLIGSSGSAQTPTATPAATATPSGTATPAGTATPRGTVTPAGTATPAATASPTVTPTPTAGEEERREKLVGSNWYFLLVTLMFGAVLFPFVVAIYRGTSGSAATGNRPLGLPVGSFRSILAYSLVAYMGFYVLTSILSVSLFAPPDFLSGIVATVIGFYFGSRSGDEGVAGLNTGTVRGIVRQGTSPAAGAVVRFKRSDDNTEPYSRIAEVNGRFELSGAKPGKYKVRASLAGSASDEQEVSVTEGSDHEIEILIKSAGAPPPPQTGTVQGTVTKPDGTAAPQASVVLSQGGAKKFEKTTDAGGKYKIDAVAAGDYEVEASLAPHTPSDKAKVKVTPNGQHTVDLKLK